MKLAAAHAIAGVVGDDLQAEYIIPSVFNRDVAPAVAAAVSAEARSSGLAREYSDLIDPLHVAGAESRTRDLIGAQKLSTPRSGRSSLGPATISPLIHSSLGKGPPICDGAGSDPGAARPGITLRR